MSRISHAVSDALLDSMSPAERDVAEKIKSVLDPVSPKKRRRVIGDALQELKRRDQQRNLEAGAIETRLRELTEEEALDRAVEVGRHIREAYTETVIPETAKTGDELRTHEVTMTRGDGKAVKAKITKHQADGIQRLLAEEDKWRHDAAAEFGVINSSPKMQRVGTSAWHKLLARLFAGTVKTPLVAEKVVDLDAKIFTTADVFVIEHDWAGALANATEDVTSGEFRLPSDACAFEFRLNDCRVITTVAALEGVPQVMLLFADLPTFGWTFMYPLRFEHGQWLAKLRASGGAGIIGAEGDVSKLVTRQIRAVAIALEAQVAEAAVVRAPHKLNRAREKRGALPISDYHVVNLAHRQRAAPLPSEFQNADHEKRRSPRLHFRRGHWRHYEAYKVWVKWILVGDPDLGFVDKHYRL